MSIYQKILLASHGTKGAVAAEDYLSTIAAAGAAVDHLVIVPDFWEGMMGDDWLNNASTQQVYGSYVENQLEEEVRQHARQLQDKITSQGMTYNVILEVGKPDECLVKQANKKQYDVIVIGSTRPKGETGYRSRMQLDPLSKELNTSLIIVPFPK